MLEKDINFLVDFNFSYLPHLPPQETLKIGLRKKPHMTQDLFRCTQRKNLGPKLKWVQASIINSGTKINPENPMQRDIDVPAAICKGTRECSKNPLYPISQFILFDKCSQSYKISHVVIISLSLTFI